MYFLEFKKVVIVAFLIFGCLESELAQSNLQYVDQKPIHFGFSIGTNMMDFNVSPSDTARVSGLNPGFSVGVVTDLRINRYLNLRFTPTLHFGERSLSYAFNTGKQTLIIPSIPVCIPVYLKYSAERKQNYRPYLIWGAGMSVDLGTDAEKPVLLKPIDFYTEFGAGCDLYFSFFKLCPELKYSIGFNDLLIPFDQRVSGTISPENQKFSTVLSKLTSKMLTLTFNFE